MVKTKIITIKDGDKDLKFKIRQMTASDMESWVMRVAQLAASSGLAEEKGGVEGIIRAILKNPAKFISQVDYEKFKPLWDELLTCCSKVDDRVEQQCDIENVNAYISSFLTLIRLRVEALNLNFSFFSKESPSEPQRSGVIIQPQGKSNS